MVPSAESTSLCVRDHQGSGLRDSRLMMHTVPECHNQAINGSDKHYPNSDVDNDAMAAAHHDRYDPSTSSNNEAGSGGTKGVDTLSANVIGDCGNTRDATRFHHQDEMRDESWLRLSIGGCEGTRGNEGEGDDDRTARISPPPPPPAGGLMTELSLFSGGSKRYYLQDQAPEKILMSWPTPAPQPTTCYQGIAWSLKPPDISDVSVSPCFLMGHYVNETQLHPQLGVNNSTHTMDRGSPELCQQDYRVIDRTRRPRSGIWFVLRASPYQSKEPLLPQMPKNYLRIRDGKMTVRLLMKYLVKKLGLEGESEIEIRCRGKRLSPLLTMQHVRDGVWSPNKDSSVLTLLPESTTDHVMVLHYGRIA